MRVAVVCEFSGKVRDAFIRRGHEAVSFDLLPTSKPGPHVVGDVRTHDLRGFDAAICFPPCTFLCNSGARWLYLPDGSRNGERWGNLILACEFFNWCLDLPVPMVGVENPIMHGHARERISRLPDQIIQPWQFGHGETKATCLWLRGLPRLTPTSIVHGRHARVHREPPGKNRWMRRSETYQGIADAMAEQWPGCEVARG